MIDYNTRADRLDDDHFEVRVDDRWYLVKVELEEVVFERWSGPECREEQGYKVDEILKVEVNEDGGWVDTRIDQEHLIKFREAIDEYLLHD